jgi:hypothetical protein
MDQVVTDALEAVVKRNVLIVRGQSLQPGFEAFQRAWGYRPNPPANSRTCHATIALGSTG